MKRKKNKIQKSNEAVEKKIDYDYILFRDIEEDLRKESVLKSKKKNIIKTLTLVLKVRIP